MRPNCNRAGWWVVPLLIVPLLTSCAPSPPRASQPIAVPVTVSRALRQDLPETLLLPGRVLPRVQTPVIAAIPGKVLHVKAHIGDPVASGAELAVLDSPATSTSRTEARSALIQLEQQAAQLGDRLPSAPAAPEKMTAATAQLEKELQQRLLQLTALLKPHLSLFPGQNAAQQEQELLRASHELTRVQSNLAQLQVQSVLAQQVNLLRAPLLQSLQAQVVQARQAVRYAEAQAQNTHVSAPHAGLVLAQTATPGLPVGPGTPLFVIGDVAQVCFELLVDPTQARQVQKGQLARVEIAGQPASEHPITQVSPTLDVTAKSFTAAIELDNPHGLYKPGMTGQATVTLNAHPGVLTVPSAALLHEHENVYVFKIAAGQAVKQPVKIGYSNGTRTEITAGLNEGDTVVVDGLTRIEAGTPVHVIEAERAP